MNLKSNKVQDVVKQVSFDDVSHSANNNNKITRKELRKNSCCESCVSQNKERQFGFSSFKSNVTRLSTKKENSASLTSMINLASFITRDRFLWCGLQQ